MGFYLLFFFGIANYKAHEELQFLEIALIIVGFSSYILGMLGVNFVAKRNILSKNNTYVIVLFALFTTILPSALITIKILLANLFVILALRRIISMRSLKEVQKKILDASILITMASLCYFWSILFLGVLLLGIAYYASQNYRNWLVPFLGIAAVYIFVTCFTLLTKDSFFSLQLYTDKFSIFFSGYHSPKQWLTFSIFLMASVFLFIRYLLKYKRMQSKTKPAAILVIATLFVAILIVLIAPEKNTSELFFMVNPITIMGVSYLEASKKAYWREVLLWIALILPAIITLF